jgi:hypothetical protein
MSDGVSGAAGTNDTPHKDDDDSTEQETHSESLLISVLIHVTVIGHSINRRANLTLVNSRRRNHGQKMPPNNQKS